MAPRKGRRGPRPGGIALVGVDRRREEHGELARASDPAGEELPEDLGLAGEGGLVAAPERRVDVAGRPDPGVVGLRHEGDRAAVLVRKLLEAVLVDRVVVGHRDGVRVAEVDLLLSRPRLALRVLDRDARRVHAVANRADERLVVAGREDVVVEDVRHRRGQAAEVLVARLLECLLEQVELELGAELGLEPRCLGAIDLRLQHLPRRGRDRRAVVPPDVAEDERRPLEPGDPPHRREVGLHDEVAVPALPARDRVAGHRVHLHLEREQVVAALGPVLPDPVEEEIAVKALPQQPSLHVGEGHDDGVERLVGAQVVQRQHRASLCRRQSAGGWSRPPTRGRRLSAFARRRACARGAGVASLAHG